MNDEIFDRVSRLGEQLQKLSNNRRLLEEARAKVYTPDPRSSLAYRRMDPQSLTAELIKDRQS